MSEGLPHPTARDRARAGDRRAAAGEGRNEQREAIAAAVGVTLVRGRVEAA